jgi:integrase
MRPAKASWARSDAATKSAAREEERRIRDCIAKTGAPFEASPEPVTAPETPPVATFGEVVEKLRASFMLTDLKVTTRRGYDSILDGVLLPRFKHLAITGVDGEAASELDLKLATKGGERKRKLTRATRRNVQIVLRSVLRFAKEKGHLSATPEGLPRLKRIEQTILEIPSDDDVHLILRKASEAQRRGFALMACGGLRPNEVRALRRRDVQLRWESGAAVGGFLSIREGRSFGETDTPKTGRREVPIAPLSLAFSPLSQRAGAMATLR